MNSEVQKGFRLKKDDKIKQQLYTLNHKTESTSIIEKENPPKKISENNQSLGLKHNYLTKYLKFHGDGVDTSQESSFNSNLYLKKKKGLSSKKNSVLNGVNKIYSQKD